MPTYEYRCVEGHDFERFYRKISDAPAEVACPVCGAEAERRLSAGAGLLFKGSGFYLTDYGKNAHRGDAKPSDASSDAKAESKSETKSESKSESKSEKSDSGTKSESKPSESKSSGSGTSSGKSDS